MVNVTPIAKLYFNSDTAQAYVRDTTVWPVITTGSGNVPLNELLNIKGLGSLQNPSGGFVFNVSNPLAPLIDIADGDVQSANYNLPTSSGSIVVGQYTLAYTASGSYSSTGNALEGGGSGYIELDDNNTSAMLLQAGDSVVISGDTNPSLNGTWTVVSTSYTTGFTFSRLYVSQNGSPIGGGAADGNMAYSITRTYATTTPVAYSGCTKVTPALNWTASPYSGEFGQAFVTDATDYTGVTLTNGLVSVKYPDGLVPAPTTNPVEGTSVTLVQLATGTYTITLTGNVFKTQTDGLTIQYTLAGIRIKGNPANVFERTVVWRGDLCCLSSCIEEVIAANYNYLKQGEESPLTSVVATVAIALGNYQVAVSCGDQAGIDSAYKEIEDALALSGCKCDCNCGCSDGPIWITNSSQEGESLITALQDQIDALQVAVDNNTDQINDIAAEILSILSALGTLTTNVNNLTTAVENIENTYVQSVSGLNTDNTDPQNPVVMISVDSTTMTGAGTPLSPIAARRYTMQLDNATNELALYRDGSGAVSAIGLTEISLDDNIPFYVGVTLEELMDVFPSESFKFAVKQIANYTSPILVLDPSNNKLVQINSAGDALLGKYPNTRDNGVGVNYLYTDVNGNVKSGNLQTAVETYAPSGGGASVYAANFSASGTDDPTMTIVNSGEANYLGNITWVRTTFGTYTGTLTGAFPSTKTTIQVSAGESATTANPIIYQAYRISNDQIRIRCLFYSGTSWSLSNAIFGGSIKIEVYP